MAVSEEHGLRAQHDASLRDFVDTAGVGLHFVGPNGIILWANASDYEPLGFTADEYIGRHIADFHADADVIADILQRLTRGERLSNYSARLRTKDGSIRKVLINSSVRCDAKGDFLHTRCFTVDVTERAELEDNLRDAHDRLRFTLETGGLGAWEWDVASGRVTWSAALETIHGMAAGTFAGTVEAYQASIHPDDRELVSAAVGRILESVTASSFEHRIVRLDGVTRWVECHGKVVLDAEQRPLRVLGVSRDITERKDSELLLRKQAEELQALGRFRERFLGIAAHDLRGPLATIVTGSHVLLKSEELPEKSTKTVARVARAAERMGRMITDLLDFTRTRLGGGLPLSPVSVDMGEAVARAIEELELAHPTRSIVLEKAGDLVGAWDADRVAQVISNLIENALRHGEGLVRVSVRSEPGAVVLAVQNRGAVIPDEALATLFDPFRRANERSEGLGLGLYIVSEIVRAHGGTVEVTSSAEQGTQFVVRWPR